MNAWMEEADQKLQSLVLDLDHPACIRLAGANQARARVMARWSMSLRHLRITAVSDCYRLEHYERLTLDFFLPLLQAKHLESLQLPRFLFEAPFVRFYHEQPNFRPLRVIRGSRVDMYKAGGGFSTEWIDRSLAETLEEWSGAAETLPWPRDMMAPRLKTMHLNVGSGDTMQIAACNVLNWMVWCDKQPKLRSVTICGKRAYADRHEGPELEPSLWRDRLMRLDRLSIDTPLQVLSWNRTQSSLQFREKGVLPLDHDGKRDLVENVSLLCLAQSGGFAHVTFQSRLSCSREWSERASDGWQTLRLHGWSCRTDFPVAWPAEWHCVADGLALRVYMKVSISKGILF
jgi:hypothetical protein